MPELSILIPCLNEADSLNGNAGADALDLDVQSGLGEPHAESVRGDQ